MLNFDMLGVGDDWPFIGARDVTDLAAAHATSLGIAFTVDPELPENVGSDHMNFADAGVPTIIFNCFCDANYHSPQDTIEFVRPDRLEEAGLVGLGIIEDLLAS
jgi:aminopeptidase YwaD